MILLNTEEKKTWVIGLMMNCPVNEALDSCPVNEKRQASVPDRLKKVLQMDECELDSILKLHTQCLHRREGIKSHLFP